MTMEEKLSMLTIPCFTRIENLNSNQNSNTFYCEWVTAVLVNVAFFLHSTECSVIRNLSGLYINYISAPKHYKCIWLLHIRKDTHVILINQEHYLNNFIEGNTTSHSNLKTKCKLHLKLELQKKIKAYILTPFEESKWEQIWKHTGGVTSDTELLGED